jgi:hypothetical protein
MDTCTPANPGRPVSPADLADTARRLKAIFVGSSGNLVEWFDFYTYSAFALYFAGSFFPAESQTAQLLNAAAIFAAGYRLITWRDARSAHLCTAQNPDAAQKHRHHRPRRPRQDHARRRASSWSVRPEGQRVAERAMDPNDRASGKFHHPAKCTSVV